MTTDTTEERLAADLIARAEQGRRVLVAIAAPPGAGKSTLAAGLVDRVNAARPCALLVPMDGFHLDNAVLEARGLLARKGAPETFDAAGFVALIRRLRDAEEGEVAIPRFDRTRDLSVAGADIVTPAHRVVVVEGNYLLLNRPPWDRLAELWDLTVWVEVPEAELERRLVGRWLEHGKDIAAARERALGNDMPNARLVIAESRPADLVIRQG